MIKADLSMFGWRDAADIALQRTNRLVSLPGIGSISYRMWAKDRPEILYVEAYLRQQAILEGAFSDAESEFRSLLPLLDPKPPRRMVDIGCGHALIDLLFYRQFQSSLHLIDIEQTNTRHHEYNSCGAGYGSLMAAKDFLTSNSVPAEKIKTSNPKKDVIADSDCDLVISLLSCGFHYPVNTYIDFVAAALRPGGSFICDIRKNTGQERELEERFDRVQIIGDWPKHLRVAVLKGAS